ncbi:hypothetical protein J8L98_15775 [Pseudoalteromonas sp. MMG013]|uniref:Orphan protein n=1 Tax=Pseudoalteromonas aurantia 208 TaxID=1314867 RepID=A0ABR9EG52_9GAMM|nr:MULTISPECIES: hypothetical protein [Pseudoalteromonas]MBE0369364.1 hypothetical protein [Pseudoalteromonas aurantia 208]MBQ4843909.1 hypothetical protein [Pseudoalteromonas sp. MMG005]MBQ4851984.1 hypothetical protein [Pseudoalteromonas sp. MMG012]MBQ4863146.1 hypothetical protein [Pseudoalteromonas sp. MMG013]
MTDKYRVVFTSLNEGISAAEATTKLSQKLKIPESKVQAFFAGKPLFSIADKEKSTKQLKLLASLGIQAKLQPASSPSTSQLAQSQRDERLFGALDYITSSLIRIEERLEELEQRLPEQLPESNEKASEQWEDDELFEELELDSPPPKRSKTVQYGLGAILIILLIILALAIAFPNLVAM